MEQNTAAALPTEADYRRYDKIWRKVSPEYDPYPEARAANASGALLALPDAEGGPCCMGPEAASELEALQGFLREEIADARIYRTLARCVTAPEARRVLGRIAAAEAGHARELQAANYLIAGEPYRVTVCFTPPRMKDYCAMLRARYHKEVCDGFNYERASEETTDFCLKKLFAALSEDEYCHAEWLRRLLMKAL